MKIIDSTIFIDALRGMEKAKLWLDKIIEEGDGAFSAITEVELLSGKDCNEKEKRESLLHLLSLFEKIPVDNPIAQIAGDFRRKYNILTPDAIIAASALYSNCCLYTKDVKDFSSIKEIKIVNPY